MDFNDNLPIYMQIMNLIKSKMASGEISGGDKLPSVRELSKELKVNPNTIQRAYQELEREELVFTQRGMGTFATEDMEVIKSLKRKMARELVNRFFMEMKKLGFSIDEVKSIVFEWIEREDGE
ncbi:MAG TPA: GntR family transcriptional regulator [Tissierellia bacterium]|nr:GntR family transcriptional regulator [Tissierellia bacterium]